jgi:hypothetical protein
LSVTVREHDLVASIGRRTQNSQRIVDIRSFLGGEDKDACPEAMRGADALAPGQSSSAT